MRDIRQFSEWLAQGEGKDVVEATQVNISDYLHNLEQEGRSAATVSRSLASLKNFYNYFPKSKCLNNNTQTKSTHPKIIPQTTALIPFITALTYLLVINFS